MWGEEDEVKVLVTEEESPVWEKKTAEEEAVEY